MAQRPVSVLGTYLKKVRDARGWRQEDLAHNLLLQPITIGRLERGHNPPKSSLLLRVSQELHLSFAALLALAGLTGDVPGLESLAPTDAFKQAASLPARDRLGVYLVAVQCLTQHPDDLLARACEALGVHDPPYGLEEARHWMPTIRGLHERGVLWHWLFAPEDAAWCDRCDLHGRDLSDLDRAAHLGSQPLVALMLGAALDPDLAFVLLRSPATDAASTGVLNRHRPKVFAALDSLWDVLRRSQDAHLQAHEPQRLLPEFLSLYREASLPSHPTSPVDATGIAALSRKPDGSWLIEVSPETPFPRVLDALRLLFQEDEQ